MSGAAWRVVILLMVVTGFLISAAPQLRTHHDCRISASLRDLCPLAPMTIRPMSVGFLAKMVQRALLVSCTT